MSKHKGPLLSLFIILFVAPLVPAIKDNRQTIMTLIEAPMDNAPLIDVGPTIDNDDKDGNIWADNEKFSLIDQPLTAIRAVNADGQPVKSPALAQEIQSMKAYLKEPNSEKGLETVPMPSPRPPFPFAALRPGVTENTIESTKEVLSPSQQEDIINEARKYGKKHDISSTAEYSKTAAPINAEAEGIIAEEEETSETSEQSTSVPSVTVTSVVSTPVLVQTPTVVNQESSVGPSQTLSTVAPAPTASSTSVSTTTTVTSTPAAQNEELALQLNQMAAADSGNNVKPVMQQELLEDKEVIEMIKERNLDTGMASQVDNLAVIQASLTNSLSLIQQEAPNDEHSYRNIYNPISLVFTFAVILATIILMMVFRDSTSGHFEKHSSPSMDVILKDVVTLYLIIVILKIAYWYGAFDKWAYWVDLPLIGMGFMVFAILWLLLSIYNVVRCHNISKEWVEKEAKFKDKDTIHREYENLHLQLNKSNSEKAQEAEKKELIEYFLMRQEFISPTFTPTVGESFLREDFDFALYLNKNLAKASENVYRYSFSSLLTILAIGVCFILMLRLPTDTQLVILGFAPLVFFVLMWGVDARLRSNYKKLVTNVTSPYDYSFSRFDNIRQPLTNVDNLKVPLYLSGKDESHASGPSSPNRHEKLFWFGSAGFMMRFEHIVLIFSILWIAICLIMRDGNYGNWEVWVILGIGALFTLINLLYIMPKTLKYFALTTSIQMMKNRRLITEVIDESKTRKAELFMKLFRLLKSISRDSRYKNGDGPTSARESIIDQVRAFYKAIPKLKLKDKNDKVSINELRDLAHFCGQDLSDDQLLYLARSCVGSGDKFTFSSFMESVDMCIDDVKQDRYKLIRDVLRSMVPREDGMVSLRELKEAITECSVLDPKDVEEMIDEMRYLPFRNAEIKIELVARFIRDTTEGLPF